MANREMQIALNVYAASYHNCLWSHFGTSNNPALVDLLAKHARYVEENTSECVAFLQDRGVDEIHKKYCQYFFALCWPIHEPWQELTEHILRRLVNEGTVKEPLPFDSFQAQARPLSGPVTSQAW